jgi:hypothetical protein
MDRSPNRRSAAILAASLARPIGAATARKPALQVILKTKPSVGALDGARPVVQTSTRCMRKELTG